MEYDSASSCDERLRELETRSDTTEARKISQLPSPWRQPEGLPAQPKVAFNVNKSLSKQVMEYYRKYSQNSNLDQYFSLPETSGQTRGVKYYYSVYELNSGPESGRQDCVGQDYNLGNYVPRERRRWARPPLIGQSSNSADNSAIYSRPLTEPRSPSPEAKLDTTETIVEEAERNESGETVTDVPERKSNTSPTSSVNSHKPLEWDSGADVGYFNTLPQNKQGNKKLSTIERMALAGGCSAALRQDPEGTTEANLSNKGPGIRSGAKSKRKPDANSTPLPGNISETDSEIEITPIVKNHVPGIIAGDDIRSDKKRVQSDTEAPISLPTFKVPPVKYATEGKKKSGDADNGSLLLKKSSSMNILAPVSGKLLLKRSQSDFNLRGRDKAGANLPLIFDSTSSLATVVNKPMTCDKVIQTTINQHFQESIGVQVSVFEEEKPPVPKRGTSLGQKGIQSILKTSKNTYRLRDSRQCKDRENLEESGNGTRPSSTDASRDESQPLSPYQDNTEDLTGRANSFEYFPGHVYENVPNGNESHVSSIDTRRSNSTMPNTSSSIDEKLWGDSDSLVRDLERSVNILKSLVDANKCDKQVKKRLIHHVVKRLVTAKYTDDKIEHNLEENVPWNPDDARKKVYRTDIIQALTKKQNTTDSSEEWKPPKQKKGTSARKQLNEEARIVDDMITLESSNSDKFDAQTDRTEMDGRKARMGLRTDDCQRSSNSPTDINKSESSECFMPQRRDKAAPRDNIFCFKQNPEVQNRDTSTSDTPLDRNRIYLDAAIDKRQGTTESSNGTRNSTDWRLPTTLSERQFELRRRSTSESGDSKLVSYAETEKKNQLLWITNEISHLSNLKKLLEQPKKLDRQRMSPRKVKHATVKQKPLALLKCVCGSNNPVASGSDFPDDSVNQQWSSHCNLATCQSTVGSSFKNINHLKKRNSCTQTGTDAVRAHSQTGGEIISTIPRNRIPETKLANIHVQTSPEGTSPRLVCPIHKNLSSIHQCKCLGQVCRCARERPSESGQNSSNKICLCHLSDSKSSYKEFSNVCHRRSPSPRWNEINRKTIDVQPVVSQISGNENRKSEPKEAKNKVNATKSMHTCDCEVPRPCQCVGGNCSCKSTLRHKKMTGPCELCLKKMTEGSKCNCVKGKEEKLCTCDNMKRKDEKLCGCPAGCNCENRKVENNICGCYRDRKCKCSDRFRFWTSEGQKPQAKPYYLSNSIESQLPQSSRSRNEGLCKCGKDCCCENKLSDIENRLYSAKRSARTLCSCESRVTESNDNNYHHCRSCGSMYKNGRKCNCHVNYPKPIAYELSFADGKVQKNSEDFVNKKNGNAEAKNLNQGNASLSPTDTPKSGGCLCEETKSRGSGGNSERTKTLQCMFEISHLRELRREKRVQLLAMASGSNLTKTPRSQKPKALPTQRKISDEEMKERLRKRYYKLHEVRNKRQLREKQEQARRNKLMANIFCKKLQQKVLKGQVDLSNSVSVISNL